MTGTVGTAALPGRRLEWNSSGAGRGGPLFRLSPVLRKAAVTVRVVTSVGWLGVHLALVAPTVNAALAGIPEPATAGYTAATLLVTVLITPISPLAGVSGPVLSLGTSWGLLRYYWVAIKLVLTTVLVLGSNLALGPGLVELASAAGGSGEPPAASEQEKAVISLSVAWSFLLAATVLSTVKPFGRLQRRPKRAGPRRGPATEAPGKG